jgi:hypothetical protein
LVLYAYLCVFAHSRFVENPPDMILGDKPLISEVVLSQDGYDILQRISSLPYELYYTYITHVPYVMYKVIFQNIDAFKTWHDRLGLGIGMIRKINGNYIGHNLKEIKCLKSSDFMCIACVTEKLIFRHSPLKIHTEPLKLLKRIQGDIYGLIQPLCGLFKYFMVLIDASTRWSHVSSIDT